jgi:hypothetical protein
MKNRKERILLAMQIILAEYREKSHYASIGYCKLCQQFYTDSNGERHRCHKCPMFVFHNTMKKNNDDLSCLERKCVPVSCKSDMKMGIKLKRVIEFYEKAIERTELLTNEDLAKKGVFDFLIDIDKEVYEKHKQPKDDSNEKSN